MLLSLFFLEMLGCVCRNIIFTDSLMFLTVYRFEDVSGLLILFYLFVYDQHILSGAWTASVNKWWTVTGHYVQSS